MGCKSCRPVMRVERYRQAMGAAVLWGALLLVAVLVPDPVASEARSASAVRLVMVEEPGCRFCRKWDAEIGPGYRRSAEGRFAPLKRVRRGAPEVKGLAPVVYTPTFVVLRSGEELGRITGYPGADYFYSELRPILAAAGFLPGL